MEALRAGIFEAQKETRRTHISTFHPKGDKFYTEGSSSDPRIQKVCIGGGEVMLEKVGEGEAQLDLTGRVEHRNGDGVVRDLAAQIKSFYSSLPKDPRLLTTAEKEELYRQIVSALGSEGALTDYGQNLARRLAGLDTLDGQVDSTPWEREGRPGSQNPAKENNSWKPNRQNMPMGATPRQRLGDDFRPASKSQAEFMSDVRQQILALSKRIEALIEKRQSSRFQVRP